MRTIVHPRESTPAADPATKLLDVFRRPSYRPPRLPRVGLALMEQSRRADADPTGLIQSVERDPGLTIDVLRLAHAPAYAGKPGVASVKQILMRLGSEALNELVLQASIAPVFRVKGYEEPSHALWLHSLATAHITRIVCRQTALDEGYAFICGLLHDAGIVAALAEVAKGDAPPFEEIGPAIQSVHDELGATVARHWRLPIDVAYVLQFHHHRDAQARRHPMAAAVCVADRLAVQLGFGYGDDDMTMLPRAAKVLGLTPAVIKLLRRQAEPVVADIA